MTEDNDEARVPLSDSSTTNDASRTRQRYQLSLFNQANYQLQSDTFFREIDIEF